MKLKKKTLPFIPLYYADFLASTDSLTNEEGFGFVRLVIHFWMHGPLINNKAMLDRIARIDSDLIVSMFFRADTEGRLYPPDFADLKAQALAEKKRDTQRTANATEVARLKRNGSVTGNSSVTETEGEGEGEGDLDSEPESESHPNSDRNGSVTEKFLDRFGTGSPTNGQKAPRVARSPQTSVTDTRQTNPERFYFCLSGGHKTSVTATTVESLKVEFPKVNVGKIVRFWASRSKSDPFDDENQLKATLREYLQKAHDKLTGAVA